MRTGRTAEKFWPAVVIMALLLSGAWVYAEQQPTAVYGQGSRQLAVATGSPGELGLLKVLAGKFAAVENARLLWFKAGSGKSLALLKEKKVDLVLVHAPAAEKKAVQEGWAAKRTLMGSNEFYLVGPADDPASVAGAQGVVDAYRRIAAARARFFSRGDQSGTHKKELAIWKKAGIKPGGDRYVVTRDFMTATLKRANDDKGYFMVDSSTWVAEKGHVPNLQVLFKGDKFLVNTYHALSQPAGATPGPTLAVQFIDFISSVQGQQIIKDFGKERYGEGLYNDATYARQYEE